MTIRRTGSMLLIAATFSACATAPQEAEDPLTSDPELGQRIEKICALPPAEREAELAKLKEEGLVLYCGSEQQSSAQ